MHISRFIFIVLSSIAISGCSLNTRISSLGGVQNSLSPSSPAAPEVPNAPITLPAPPTLNFSISPSDAIRNEVYAGPAPATTGSDVVFTISPALPAGLIIDSATGIISGTPAVAFPSTNFTVTATNSGGSAQTIISLAASLKMTVNSTANTADANPGDQICADAGSNCSLAAAIEEANAITAKSIIMLGANTFLISSELSISKTVTFEGQGDTTILDAAGDLRIFNISGSGVVLKKMKFYRGNSGATGGGAIIASGNGLTLDHVTIESSTTETADKGGGGLLFTGSGILSIIDSTFKGNSHTGGSGSDLGGGGLYVSSFSATSVIERTVFENNSSQWTGGGAFIEGDFTIKNSVFKNNTIVAGCGAGVSTRGTGKIDGSTVMNNVNTNGDGGGYCINGGIDAVEIINSTFYGNTANYTWAEGGGIYANLGNNAFESSYKLRIINTTITNNSSGSNGGGLYVGFTTKVRVENSIISANLGGGTNCYSFQPTYLISEGYNIDSANSCGFAATGDLVNTDPLLVVGPPVVQGGFVPTIALQSSSPAINTGQSTYAPLIDARGALRTPATCDRGAFEF